MRLLVVACSQEDEWGGLTFSALPEHDRYPFGSMQGYRSSGQWTHLLTSCKGVDTMQVGCHTTFVQYVYRALDVPLAYFSMSHHVASSMRGLLLHA